MTHYEEHFHDQHCDTWQAAEAAQFLRDEVDGAEADRAFYEAEALEDFRELYPTFQ